jgi:vitamin B12 transporter
MAKITRPLGCTLATIYGVGSLSNLARAQDSISLPEFTVTADRVEEPVYSTGSDVTVIPGSRIQQWGANGITEVLREVVGVDVTAAGGPNSLTEVRVRGADPGQSLVMIDGVPIGNVAGTDGSLDFSNLSAIDIDRIEIVRGPQSSLYGSDAMSGVINIITKKGKKGEQHTTLTVQVGSYGTIQATATTTGATDNWTYSLGVTDVYTLPPTAIASIGPYFCPTA